MSSTTHTGEAATATATADQDTATTARTEAEDKLWEALHANPNSTAADLSTDAGIGRSTAAKILVRWANDGSITRTPGISEGGRRAADRSAQPRSHEGEHRRGAAARYSVAGRGDRPRRRATG